MNTKLVQKKMITGEADTNLLLKSVIDFNLKYIIPIIYKNSEVEIYDEIAKKENKLDFLNNSIK